MAVSSMSMNLAFKGRALCRGYWQDVANVERELRAFMGLYGIAGRMPTARELQSRGANSLYGAIHKHGGFAALAQRLGLRPQRYGLPISALAACTDQTTFCTSHGRARAWSAQFHGLTFSEVGVSSLWVCAGAQRVTGGTRTMLGRSWRR